MGSNFRGLIFADACTHAHYTLYNCAYFAGLIFADSSLSVKTAKIGPHENFPLYSNHCVIYLVVALSVGGGGRNRSSAVASKLHHNKQL